MIHLVTDFGREGPYQGEMAAACRRVAPEVPVLDLLADAPAFEPLLASALLRALTRNMAPGEVVLAVVDPGVGGERRPLALCLDGLWLVGPDNGLFELPLRKARHVESWLVAWRPASLSRSFHGRDLFAPVAARLARGDRTGLEPLSGSGSGDGAGPMRFPGWAEQIAHVLLVDRYGNCWTGLEADGLSEATVLEVAGRELAFAATFSAVPQGEAFWYVNSAGLVEIAVNGGSAASILGLRLGDPVAMPRELRA